MNFVINSFMINKKFKNLKQIRKLDFVINTTPKKNHIFTLKNKIDLIKTNRFESISILI